MANYIHVDHSQITKAASAVSTYTANHKSNMTLAHGEVTGLGASWQGDDYTQFQTQWNKVTENSSVSQNMLNAMENYKEFLQYASGKYKQMQIDSINQANKIPKTW